MNAYWNVQVLLERMDCKIGNPLLRLLFRTVTTELEGIYSRFSITDRFL